MARLMPNGSSIVLDKPKPIINRWAISVAYLEYGIPMQIKIPPHAEPVLRERASAAGFDKLEEYALQRILFDDAEIAAMDAAAVDPQTIAHFEEGLRSGPVAAWTSDDFRTIREQIHSQNSNSGANR